MRVERSGRLDPLRRSRRLVVLEALSRVAEIVVVGSGIIGLGVAYELARRGARVTVLDARAAGRGASQASAGVLAPYIEAPAQGALRDLSVESLGLYDEFVARVESDARMAVEYRHTGTIDVALDADEAERLKATASRAADARRAHGVARRGRHLPPRARDRARGGGRACSSRITRSSPFPAWSARSCAPARPTA